MGELLPHLDGLVPPPQHPRGWRGSLAPDIWVSQARPFRPKASPQIPGCRCLCLVRGRGMAMMPAGRSGVLRPASVAAEAAWNRGCRGASRCQPRASRSQPQTHFREEGNARPFLRKNLAAGQWPSCLRSTPEFSLRWNMTPRLATAGLRLRWGQQPVLPGPTSPWVTRWPFPICLPTQQAPPASPCSLVPGGWAPTQGLRVSEDCPGQWPRLEGPHCQP